MSQYVLGILKTINEPNYGLMKAVSEGHMSVDKRLQIELDSWDSIINVAKGQSTIKNPIYDADPYFYLKSYVSNVGVFNYKTHVKSNFLETTQKITKEHLEPAKRNKRDDLVDVTRDMLNLTEEVYKEVQLMDPSKDQGFNDVMRTLTSLTYFRLMGGNLRSAARNGTQRLWEFVEFGAIAKKDAFSFYNGSGQSTSNLAAFYRQLKFHGLQWFDGKSKEAHFSDYFKGKNVDLSNRSRGALEEAYVHDNARLYIDKNGELTIRAEDGILGKVARGTGLAAGKLGVMHKIVEDWNRAGTYKVAFALAYNNLTSAGTTWKVKKNITRQRIVR